MFQDEMNGAANKLGRQKNVKRWKQGSNREHWLNRIRGTCEQLDKRHFGIN